MALALLGASLMGACDVSLTGRSDEHGPRLVFMSAYAGTTVLTSLATQGPECSSSADFMAVQVDTDEFGVEIRYSVEDTTLAVVTGIPRAGGTIGMNGRLLWGRKPGTTKLVATASNGLTASIPVVIAPPAAETSFLLRMPSNRPSPHGALADSIIMARGDTATVTIATDPGGCNATWLPQGFTITAQSADPAVAQLEATETRTWTAASLAADYPSIGVNTRVRAVAAGRTEVVASTPYGAPRRIRVIVR